jgi:hypothetical protein
VDELLSSRPNRLVAVLTADWLALEVYLEVTPMTSPP